MNNIKKKSILIFPAGTEIAFEIFNALSKIKNLKIIGGTSISDHSEMVFKDLIYDFPFIQENNFIEYLNEIIVKEQIQYIYPAHDSVLLKLTENAEKINAKIITTNLETVRICRSKERTYDFFQNEDFIPKVYEKNSKFNFPVFIKPKVGQGSIGTQYIKNSDELNMFYKKDDLICEYLPGNEITVDCYTNTHGILKVILPRTRERIKNGISVRSQKIDLSDDIANIANKINNRLSFLGAWFFQLKKNSSGKYKLLEISPRIPGTMGVSRNLGINFPLLSIYAIDGIDCEIILNNYNIMVDRALDNRYKIGINYDKVYIDLDDTLFIDSNVNIQLIAFLYQCINNKKKLYLLTKHNGSVIASLIKNRISLEIFDDIFHINFDEEKYKYIDSNGSIFIDDSFSERKKVKETLNIPTYDVDMIECLIDRRL